MSNSYLSARHASSWNGSPYMSSSAGMKYPVASDPYNKYDVTDVPLPEVRGRMFSQRGNAWWAMGCADCNGTCGQRAVGALSPDQTATAIVSLLHAVTGVVAGAIVAGEGRRAKGAVIGGLGLPLLMHLIRR